MGFIGRSMLGLKRGTVELRPFDTRWKSSFEMEAKRIKSLVNPAVIEHIGSTSVNGMQAKPIIDMLVAFENMQSAVSAAAKLESAEYIRREESDAVDRCFLVKGAEVRRTHHISLVAEGSATHTRAVLFRDMLRKEEVLAREYIALKRLLAEQYSDNRREYTRLKSSFIEKVLGSCG